MEKELIFLKEETVQILEQFLRGHNSKRTKEEYRNTVILLCEKLLMKDFLDITEVDAEQLFVKMQEKIYNNELTYKTVCYRLTVYNAFAKFIMRTYPELEFYNPFAKIERPVIIDRVSPAKTPSIEELDKIISVAKEKPMYYLIIALATRCGLSATNIIRLTKTNIYIEKDKMGLYIPHPENENKTISILLPEDVKDIFKRYLSTLKFEDEQKHLFYNKHGRALSLKNLSDNIGEIVKAADLEFHYTLKDMRSRAILDLVESGADEETVQQYMGLGPMRTRQFFEAKGMAAGCPVDLVNYRLKTT